MKPDSTPPSPTATAEPPGSGAAMLAVDGLAKSYPNKKGAVRAIEQVSFTLHEGEFVSIVGPSGCGKTTLLSCIAGLLPPTGGSVTLGGRAVTGPPPGLSVVFQDYSRSLFPWLSVESNVGLPMKSERASKAEIKRDVARLLTQVGLDPSVGGRYPWQLSGGMQQRVAIARALISHPKVLLMDEPFASVDAQTRTGLEDLLLRVWEEYNKTILFVTHDIDEAVYLSDRIVVLSKSPSSVVAELEVPLPRPRDQFATKENPVYAQLRAEVFRLVMKDMPAA
ncbi:MULTISPECIES: ABC transporter ATP-binding protein [Actinomadura]|uniref:ABC transporter ATP-binding protein n=1 Tax=Actinomadura livida TaxID=79909 RepID=A0A7W7I7C4_9ACTN|nr:MULTISPECIES: ABC transporter ATP-binding protein [Actinomadura]MBB4771719.1 NitT/TauT family transport system ATP-binding protein [Actinomadura catellatispora]GGU02084.1 ABC transporter [Actinomadura livida]